MRGSRDVGPRRRLIGLAAGTALLGGLIAPSTAPAAVTIGSDLSPNPINAPCSGGNCTIANPAIPGAVTSSPINGVVVSWTVRDSNIGTNARLRVIQPVSGGAYLGVSSSSTHMLPSPGAGMFATVSFATQQPIKAGQLIALDLDSPNTNNIGLSTNSQVGVTDAYWEPALLDGASTPPTSTTGTGEYTFNAVVEPDADCDGMGDETQDPLVSGGCAPPKAAKLGATSVLVNGNTISLPFECPTAGGNCTGNQVSLMSAGPVKLGAVSAAKKRTKRKLISIGSSSFAINAGATQTVSIPLSAQARKALRKRRTLVATATISGGGNSSTASLTIIGPKSKRKPKG